MKKGCLYLAFLLLTVCCISASAGTLELPESLQTIGAEAFAGDEGVQVVICPEGSLLESIGEKAFYGSGLTDLYVPDTLQSIGEDAFGDLPENFLIHVSIGTNAWDVCAKAVGEEHLIDANLHYSIGTSEWKEDSPVFIRIYQYTGNQENLVIPETIQGYPVEIIANRAFAETSIVSIVLPSTLKEMSGNAFWDCKNLETVTIKAEYFSVYNAFISGTETVNCPFYGCTNLKTLYTAERIDYLTSKLLTGVKQYVNVIAQKF